MRDTYAETKLSILQAGRRLIAQKGFTGVGLNELLSAADIPKGSFYHYFGSKERYGRELIEQYVDEYLLTLDKTFDAAGNANTTARERLLTYWGYWLETQCCEIAEHKCLVVKLSAEVADLSDDMRVALHSGTEAFIARIADAIRTGVAEGSLHTVLEPYRTAQMLYQMWLGASLLSKLSRDREALESAMDVTRRVLVAP
ncbi:MULTISPECIES: TetR/AcrR family transcriptional regulator [unclassified Herbaspirillum]|uniref:TetR/AcrR family transcriptional regulator n=1 Tax=unclassified Herbaspirillum TaxID=2624150 RepID=UPI000E2F8E8D|nr:MULTISPECIES: TetR/AcrR family transcriptional regulator [unclassified Herbaspirillum]RFB69655.1 TetR/AcrR family transcriptional regulator [Herbaspirillum sp. 3R-3a1]TFI07279.1 TetR/AcrR family transcriptional regulator [Herbaspirillum sp. 3R11]TFI12054.1 TetR/AcrR family transcriptional regulator [Herbaspirillum sp. 3R-11]TFI26349.1 TetR/AcrR family transcriptional regulator [Herbaspirillum sp. 3C11]